MSEDTQVDVQLVINDLLEQLRQTQLQLAIVRAQLVAAQQETPVEGD